MSNVNSTECDNDLPDCGGCGYSMRLEAAHDSADIDGRFRCVDCRLQDAADAAAEREYDAEQTARIPVETNAELVFGGAA